MGMFPLSIYHQCFFFHLVDPWFSFYTSFNRLGKFQILIEKILRGRKDECLGRVFIIVKTLSSSGVWERTRLPSPKHGQILNRSNSKERNVSESLYQRTFHTTVNKIKITFEQHKHPEGFCIFQLSHTLSLSNLLNFLCGSTLSYIVPS